ncbi:hypothetical protein DM720_15050 [Salmonella enterica subsp. enterica serovar Onireke]|nr:hypothetical protein [Salmonella enterica subsp. enterica serovar Onireke]
MIDISSAEVEKIIVHYVGNKIREEGFKFSSSEAHTNESLNDLLLKHYLLPLSKTNNCYRFHHESDINLNELFQFSSRIFDNSKDFKEQSINIAKHLYSTSTHPNISGGDFIVILFSNIKVDDESCHGIAALRIENKDEYLDIKNSNGVFELHEKTGISLSKIQKGALILSNINTVYAIDSMGQKTKYWLDSFLKVIPMKTYSSCIKASGEILSSISSKIKDTTSPLLLSNDIDHKINSSETISIKEIKEMASNHLSLEDIDTVFTNVSEKYGFDLSDDIKVESKALLPYAKKISKKTRITDGVSLIITNKTHHIENISITKKDNKLQALIEMNIKE